MEFLRSLLGCNLAWKPVGWRREMWAVFSGHDISVCQAANYNWLVWKRKRKKEKVRARREKGGEAKKTMDVLLVFIMAALEIVFDRKKKKLLDGRGLFGDNVFKNPARYILQG